MPKYLNIVQGSTEWCDARMGIPTASNFDRIITPKGKPSTSAPGFVNELIVEVMLGRPLIGVMTPWMQHGKDTEAEAIKYYELMTDAETVPVGLILTDDGRVGASPDRLVGENGLVEVKSPSVEVASKYLSAHIDMLLGIADGEAGSAYAAYRCQVQGQLYVSGRDWCDVMAYYPGIPSAIQRIKRDEDFIASLKTLLQDFLGMFDTRLAKLKALGYLDEAAAKKARVAGMSDDETRAFGLSQQDVDQYVVSLKAEGKL